MSLYSARTGLRSRPVAFASPSQSRQLSVTVSNTLVSRNPGVLMGAEVAGPDQTNCGATRLPTRSASQGVSVEQYAMRRCIELHERAAPAQELLDPTWRASGALQSAYKRCGDITSEYAKTFYLGTQLMAPSQATAIWAVYVWCRRTDELVDGPQADQITPQVCWVRVDVLIQLVRCMRCHGRCQSPFLEVSGHLKHAVGTFSCFFCHALRDVASDSARCCQGGKSLVLAIQDGMAQGKARGK